MSEKCTKEQRQQELRYYYFSELEKKKADNNSGITLEMIQNFYSRYGKSRRTLNNDLKAIGLRPYGSGNGKFRYYQLDVVKDLRLIILELNKLLEEATIYKPIQIASTIKNGESLAGEAPQISFYRIILHYPNETPEKKNNLITINTLLERYFIITKNDWSNIFYKTEYTNHGIEYTLIHKKNTILIWNFLYYCQHTASGLNLEDIQIRFYRKIKNGE